MTQPTRSRVLAGALALGACIALAPAPAVAQEDLTLRVRKTEGRPGGPIALTLRTYSSKQVGQGQLCFRFTSRAPQGESGSREAANPFERVLGAVVFSDAGDARSVLSTEGGALVLRFGSETASINQTDGPLAGIYFLLSPDATPGTRFDVVLDAADTFLLDENGEPIPISPEAGEIRVLEPGDLFDVSAAAEDTLPGTVALLSMQTSEIERLSEGQVALRYDPEWTAGPPTVTIDPRYGDAVLDADVSEPGLVLVTFESPDGSLNRLPGDVVSVEVPSRADVPPGSRYTIALDPSLTFLVDRDGVLLPLDFEQDELIFQ